MHHSGNRDHEPFEMNGLAGEPKHQQHGEVADELQRKRRRDRRVDDDLVRKRDLPDQTGVSAETHGAALQPLLRGEPGP